MNNQKEHRKAIVGLVIFTALLMLGGAIMADNGSQTAPRASQAEAITNNSIIPNPTLDTNVTWSNFYSGWNPLEYNNGTGNQTLNTGISTIYQNPVSIQPKNIVTPQLQTDKVGGTYWSNTTLFAASAIGGGSVTSLTSTTAYGGRELSYTQNTSETSTYYEGFCTGHISSAELPSNQVQYDYITYGLTLSGPKMTGVDTALTAWNTSSDNGRLPNTTIYPGQSEFVSEPLSNMVGANFAPTVSNGFKIEIQLALPEAASTTYTVILSQLALSTTPFTLGTHINNGNETNTGALINPTVSKFNPDFAYTEITQGGYSVAVSQTMQNITLSKASINNGRYSEQVTYQGIETLPTAPDLTYGAANITMPMEVNGKQYEVANVNGVSFLSEIQTKTNGTFSFGSVNPNSQNTIILEVQYTSSQWNKVSGAPGFFSDPIGAIEYYWYIFLGVALGAIGLGAGFKSKSAGFRVGKK